MGEGKNGEFVGVDGGDHITAMWTYFMPLSYTLENG